MKKLKKCSVCGSANKSIIQKLDYFWKTLQVLKDMVKYQKEQSNDPNEIKVLGWYAIIVLYDPRMQILQNEALIDKTDELVKIQNGV